ncbi:MAG: ribonuclease HII [Candidatus Levybacteria bacterium]|nr:ribonuclease HII [Candidatus Levybacteria bacterium]
MSQKPSFTEEQEFWNKGYELVIGMDEVGRGAFAGPVLVGAVIFSKDSYTSRSILDEVKDSKQLSSKSRQKLNTLIKRLVLFSTTAEISVSIINRLGIGKATQMAFRKAIKTILERFPNKRKFVLVDGFHIKYFKGIGLKNQKGIIRGDQKSFSIAAASIIAKVERDNIMEQLHKKYPQYGFAKHKGYGTKQHQMAIKKYGLSMLHRMSFNLQKFLI